MFGKISLILLMWIFSGVISPLAALQPVPAVRAETPPVIDGKLDDAIWSQAMTFSGFRTFKPDYGKVGSEETVAYMAYDQNNIYFAARCRDNQVNKIKASITKRDNMFGDDWIGFTIDTFNDGQSGYGFLVNPLGIQGDGILNSEGNLDASLDLVWESKGVIDEEGYTVELKVPFSSIRFPYKKDITMGLWLIRNIVRTSENLSFPELYPDKGATMSNLHKVTLSDIAYRRTVEVLPAFTHSRIDSRREGVMAKELRDTDISLTGKLGLTSQLTLDATYNPDFSQVESDAGQIDVNQRYALYFHEKRPFFLEGKELFEFAGNTEEGPLYSVVHTRNIIDPLLGVKVSGKVAPKTTAAILFARDESTLEDFSASADFSIFRIKQALREDSYIGGFFTSRGLSEYSNRILGVDGNIRINGSSNFGFHAFGSSTRANEKTDAVTGHAAALRYTFANRSLIMDIGIQDISENFQIDSGFLTRPGFTRVAFFSMFRIYPKSKFFQRLEPFYWSYHLRDKATGLWETFNMFTMRFQMPGQSMLRFDFILGNEVFGGKQFNAGGAGINFNSQITREIFLQIFFRHTDAVYYDPANPSSGTSNRCHIALGYQPTEQLDTFLSMEYRNFFRENDGEKLYDYMILRSRNTFQLNKYLLFRGIAEYNTYRERLTLDLLASFTYIPGTVVHIGYGSALEKLEWDPLSHEYINHDKLLEMRRGLFFKVSYLWRL